MSGRISLHITELMGRVAHLCGCIILYFLTSCSQSGGNEQTLDSFPVANAPGISDESRSTLASDMYHDKILGMLIGSAIGDAMGAPTEMWHRDDIKIQAGYVDSFDPVIRPGSPEGPWDYNLPPGGTTDDTRWKYLLGELYAEKGADLNARDFAQNILDVYVQEKDHVGQSDDFDPESIETEILHMTWLQEWAKVAKPYLDNEIDAFSAALNKFYGGEMACAGMLYAPLVGAIFGENPIQAYNKSYELGIFDLGYARDITGLTAAYVAQAMVDSVQIGDIGAVTATVDPQHYFKSRLVGRIAHRIYQDAKRIVYEARQVVNEGKVPVRDYPYDPAYYHQVEEAYRLLDEKLQDIPFHAGEIHLINLTALEFCDGDFKKTIEFVVNYGRDNDTVAAVTGAILGAYLGASNLPDDWKSTALKINRDNLGIDLEELANQIFAVVQ